MKKMYLMVLVLSITLLSSCGAKMAMVTITSHQQAMDSYKTADQLIKEFGIPTSKRVDGELEEWNYLFGVKTVTEKKASLRAAFGGNKSKSSSSSASATALGKSVSGNSTGSSTSETSGGGSAGASAQSVSQEIKTFVKFTLKGDEVITWKSNGVDYGSYEMREVEKEN